MLLLKNDFLSIFRSFKSISLTSFMLHLIFSSWESGGLSLSLGQRKQGFRERQEVFKPTKDLLHKCKLSIKLIWLHLILKNNRIFDPTHLDKSKQHVSRSLTIEYWSILMDIGRILGNRLLKFPICSSFSSWPSSPCCCFEPGLLLKVWLRK